MTATPQFAFLLAALTACSKTPPPDPPPSPEPETTVAASASPEPAAPGTAAEPEAASSNVTIKTLFVDDKLADCQGVGDRKCMRTRESADGEWEFFYDDIEGFKYEPKYQYELKVEVKSDPNPPADGSSLKYRLLEVVSKKKSP